jgi:hypothetical protein
LSGDYQVLEKVLAPAVPAGVEAEVEVVLAPAVSAGVEAEVEVELAVGELLVVALFLQLE